jgi:hypothetical protein
MHLSQFRHSDCSYHHSLSVFQGLYYKKAQFPSENQEYTGLAGIQAKNNPIEGLETLLVLNI